MSAQAAHLPVRTSSQFKNINASGFKADWGGGLKKSAFAKRQAQGGGKNLVKINKN